MLHHTPPPPRPGDSPQDEGATPSSALPDGLASLYQEVIVEHYKRPRFKAKGQGCQFCQEGKNPLCGDHIVVYCRHVLGEDGLERISLSFEGSGCSISQASASMMCHMMQNLTLQQARAAIAEADAIYTGKERLDSEDLERDIEALNGVARFPVRVKCAALPWKTLELLLNDNFSADGVARPSPCGVLHEAPSVAPRKLKVVQ